MDCRDCENLKAEVARLEAALADAQRQLWQHQASCDSNPATNRSANRHHNNGDDNTHHQSPLPRFVPNIHSKAAAFAQSSFAPRSVVSDPARRAAIWAAAKMRRPLPPPEELNIHAVLFRPVDEPAASASSSTTATATPDPNRIVSYGLESISAAARGRHFFAFKFFVDNKDKDKLTPPFVGWADRNVNTMIDLPNHHNAPHGHKAHGAVLCCNNGTLFCNPKPERPGQWVLPEWGSNGPDAGEHVIGFMVNFDAEQGPMVACYDNGVLGQQQVDYRFPLLSKGEGSTAQYWPVFCGYGIGIRSVLGLEQDALPVVTKSVEGW